MSLHQSRTELIKKAENSEWTLQCDEELLHLIQDVSSKIESRSASSKSNINAMMLSLDETKVKFSNLTRINSIKQTNYCENLIADDLDSPDGDPPHSKEPVKLSPQIAIENGLKMMANCFEKHRVNFDPSMSQSETSIVYRPIDKYMSVLPHLIGSDKWKEQWHVGLLESDMVSHVESENYAESVDSNVSSLKPSEPIMNPASNLLASQDSLAKSNSSIGDQMVINKQGGLFDEIMDEQNPSVQAGPSSSFFRPQVDQRKIVNLFDDEPPSMEPSPEARRKPENLFDDYGSVESLPIPPLDDIVKQPVDLFNDSEFDSFIKKIETQQEAILVQANANLPKGGTENPLQRDIRKITQEIKTVQLKKVKQNVEEVKQIPVQQKPSEAKKPIVDISKKQEITAVRKPVETPSPQKRTVVPPSPASQKIEPPELVATPEAKSRVKKFANLFDDDDDEEEDFFGEIIKQKAASKPPEPAPPKAAPTKTKISSLFDDDEDDDEFDSIFTEKTKALPSSQSSRSDSFQPDKKYISLVDDEPPPFLPTKSDVIKKSTSLFDDFDEPEIFQIKPTDPEVSKKSNAPEPQQETLKINAKKTEEIQVEEKVEEVENTEVKDIIVEKETFEQPLKEEESMGNFASNLWKPKGEAAVVSDLEIQAAKECEENVLEASENVSSDLDEAEVLSESPPPIVTPISTPKKSNIAESSSPPPDFVDNQKPEESATPHPPSRNSILPFLDDEPPPDDDDEWHTDDNNDNELDSKAANNKDFRSSSSNYPVVPLFDDVPPEDDDFNGAIPELTVESDDDYEQAIAAPRAAPITAPLVEPLPEVKPEVKKPEKSTDEIDRSLGSVKSKAGIFAMKTEAPVREVTKPLPGKLNSSLKINIGALMPGARLPPMRKADEVSSNNLIAEERSQGGSAHASPQTVSKVASEKDSSGLLNNDLAKTRVRIQVKRKPSTRRGRQSVYQQALSSHIEDEPGDDDEDDTLENPPSNQPLKVPLTKNLAKSIFDDMNDDDDDFLNHHQHESKPVEKEVKPQVTTNKISVFYDDEDDTRMMLEKRKLEAEKASQNYIVNDLEDDLEDRQLPKVPKLKHDKVARKIFGDESDDDLFSATKPSANKEPVAKQKPLFDDADDDDLFGSNTIKIAKTSSKLFDSDEDVPKVNVSKPEVKKPKKQSLFGDEDSDDGDDLFSSKPKSSSRSSIISKPTTVVKKQSSEAINDPLKDLLDN